MIIDTFTGAVKSIGSGLLGAGKWGLEKAGGGWNIAKTLTLPLRLSARPFTWSLGKIWEGVQGAINTGRKGIYSTLETGKSLAMDGIVRPLKPLVMPPIDFLKLNLVDNFPVITKGIGQYIVNTVRTPVSWVLGAGQLGKSILSGGYEVGKSLFSFDAANIASATRNAVRNVGAPAWKQWVQGYTEAPKKVGGNVYNSIANYWRAIPKTVTETRQGARNVISAPVRGWQKGTDIVAQAEKVKDEAEKAAEKAAKETEAEKILAAAKGNKKGANQQSAAVKKVA